MKDLVEYIVKQLVSTPEKVVVEEEVVDSVVTLTLNVDPQDMGIVIGKAGQTIKAIRKLLAIRAVTEEVKVYLQLVDSGNQPMIDSEQSSSPADESEISEEAPKSEEPTEYNTETPEEPKAE